MYTLGFMNVTAVRGENVDVWTLGMAIYTNIILVVNIKVIMETQHWTFLSPLVFGLSFLLYLILALAFSHWPSLGGSVLGLVESLFSSWMFLISLFVTVILAAFVDWAYNSFKLQLFPEVTHYIQQKEYLRNDQLKSRFFKKEKATIIPEKIVIKSTTVPIAKKLPKFRGYAFSEADPASVRFVRSNSFISDSSPTNSQINLKNKSNSTCF
ncbi:phospholipid-translocating P-type ATPase, flippase subfamily protein [Cardiosporidium cionae]|uniref:Phospholipid-translocating P-type ATPase, flippase subfamily protein n=1 Tax=Cardiosporidium cionae TaxID=476202 RepID=A0ABQ7J5M0_9APIC|nr:phospholipid-translocating P-type ATPase, flippase subfamily protein [Cardiosporidium cionae]|eukprot:KAF8818526.1 phospholipid-translocating P-type ATPase, flippase subfamily protein [Cardiosporidium cionae]